MNMVGPEFDVASPPCSVGFCVKQNYSVMGGANFFNE